jgi:hypothetical protein
LCVSTAQAPNPLPKLLGAKKKIFVDVEILIHQNSFRGIVKL